MNRLNRLAASIAAAGLLVLTPAGAAYAFVDDPKASVPVIVCNKTKEKMLYVVIGQRTAEEYKLWVRGWWAVALGACVNTGPVPYGHFWFYAQSADGVRFWPNPLSTKHSVCVRDGKVCDLLYDVFNLMGCNAGERKVAAGVDETYYGDRSLTIPFIDSSK